MPNHLEHFGRRIRELRQVAGLSQEELAARAGLHRTYVGAIERGERNLGLINIYAIADALGLPIESLFNGRPSSSLRSLAKGRSIGSQR